MYKSNNSTRSCNYFLIILIILPFRYKSDVRKLNSTILTWFISVLFFFFLNTRWQIGNEKIKSLLFVFLVLQCIEIRPSKIETCKDLPVGRGGSGGTSGCRSLNDGTWTKKSGNKRPTERKIKILFNIRGRLCGRGLWCLFDRYVSLRSDFLTASPLFKNLVGRWKMLLHRPNSGPIFRELNFTLLY